MKLKQRMRLKKRQAILMTCFSLLPAIANATIIGEITTNNAHVYAYTLGTSNIPANTPGSSVAMPVSDTGVYSATLNCHGANFSGEPTYYMSTAPGLTASTVNPGYLKLNDYIDVKIEVWIAGQVNQYFTVPFGSTSNNYAGFVCSSRNPVQQGSFSTGSKVRVTFKITKPIINGMSIQNMNVAQLFGRAGHHSAGFGNSPMAIIQIKSGIITVPDKCTVNNGQPIAVNFGDIPNDDKSLDGSQHAQNIPIHVNCTGGSFTSGNVSIKLAIQPAAAGIASFDPNYLGTTGTVDRKDLAIKLTDSSGKIVKPNTFVPFTGFQNNQGDWNLIAYPVAKPGSNIPEGDFDSSATVIADFQ